MGLPRPGVGAAILALALLVPALAAAGDVAFNTTTTTLVEYHWGNQDQSDTNDDYLDVVNRLNFSFKGPVLQTDLRIDTFTLVPAEGGYPKEAPTGKRYRDDYRLERLTGILSPGGGIKLTFGDFYAQFGSGIALALRKVDELGLETVLRGGRLDGTWGLFSLTALAGLTNVNNLDPQDYYFAEDPLDKIAGLRLGIKSPGGRLKLGAHSVWLRPASTDATYGRPDTWISGGDLDASLVPGKLQLGLEGDFGFFEGEHHESLRRGEHTGFALYLNMRTTLGPVSILLEGKWYDAFAVEGSKRYPSDLIGIAYSQPPTAERIDQEVESSSSVVGGRLKIDWNVIQGLTIFGNVGGGDYVAVTDLIRAGKDETPEHKGQYLHAYGGLDLRWSSFRSSLVVSGGYRTEREPKDPEDMDAGWKQHKSIGHAEARANIFLAKDWSLHLSALHEQRMKLLMTRFEYMWGTYIAGFNWAGILDVSGAFEYDTDVLTADWYGWGMVKWYIRQNLVLSLLGGTQRGGLKCVGGVCKMVPPFAGVRAELVFRY